MRHASSGPPVPFFGEIVPLVDDLVRIWRDGAPDNWPAFAAKFDELEATWPR